MLKVVEFVDGALLVLRVGSRSGKFDGHDLSLELDESNTVTGVNCACPSRLPCHHLRSLYDLIGKGGGDVGTNKFAVHPA